jgi:hypothetical protein
LIACRLACGAWLAI